MSRPRQKELVGVISKIQDKVGAALADYHNDRAPDRADRVINALSYIFDLCVETRSHFPVEW